MNYRSDLDECLIYLKLLFVFVQFKNVIFLGCLTYFRTLLHY